MPMFDDPRAFAELSELLADERTTIDLITLQASPVRGEVPAGRTFASRRLRVSEQVQSDFVRAAARTLRSFARRVVREYYPGWVSIDDELAEAPVEDLEGPLLEEIRRSVGGEYAADFLVTENEDVDTSIGAYALVISNGARPGDTAVSVRQRNPVEKLGQGRFTARWSGEQLDKVESVFVFDAGVDIVVWRGAALIRSARVLEALFVGEEIRMEGARRAVEALNGRITLRNRPELETTIEADSVFAARFRNIERRGLLATMDLEALRRSSEKFGLARRMLRDDGLVFLAKRGWRFHWLAALEDSLVESAGSGALYNAQVKRSWVRRAVEGSITTADGTLEMLCGPDWGPLAVTELLQQLEAGNATYYVELDGQRAELDALAGAGGLELALLGPPGLTVEHLSALPRCD